MVSKEEVPYTVSDIYQKIAGLLSEGRSLALASVIRVEGSAPRRAGAKMVVCEDGRSYGTIGGGCLESYVVHEARKTLEEGRSKIIHADLGDDSWSGIGMACGGKIEVFIEPIRPDPRLIILGSGHVARALAKLAPYVGYKLFVVDPFAKEGDFPAAEKVFSFDRPDGYLQTLKQLRPSQNDSIVITTRHRDDADALKAALAFPVGYVGMVGSKSRVKLAYEELKRQGIGEEELSRVFAPIGLDIGAETPEEIALSILAEILKVKRGGTGASKTIKLKQASATQG